MTDRMWYYTRGGQQQGPINTPQLKQLISTGQIQAADLVWTDQMENWKPAGEVKDLLSSEGGATDAPAAATAPAVSSGAEATGSQYSQQFSAATQLAGAASREAAGAMTALVSDPIGGLAPCFQKLGSTRALQVGIVFLVAFLLLRLVTVFTGGSVIPIPGFGAGSTAKAFFGTLLMTVAAVGAMIGVSTLFRITSKSAVGLEGDLYTVGAALLPLGIALFSASILNVNSEVVLWIVLLVVTFAAIFTVLMLFTGQIKIAGLSERFAAVAVGCMVAAALLAARIVGAILY
jgi:uncharacterized protein DUF4339